jgi:hypothetical protein
MIPANAIPVKTGITVLSSWVPTEIRPNTKTTKVSESAVLPPEIDKNTKTRTILHSTQYSRDETGIPTYQNELLLNIIEAVSPIGSVSWYDIFI